MAAQLRAPSTLPSGASTSPETPTASIGSVCAVPFCVSPGVASSLQSGRGVALFNPLDLQWRSPDRSELWHKSRDSKRATCSLSEGAGLCRLSLTAQTLNPTPHAPRPTIQNPRTNRPSVPERNSRSFIWPHSETQRSHHVFDKIRVF